MYNYPSPPIPPPPPPLHHQHITTKIKIPDRDSRQRGDIRNPPGFPSGEEEKDDDDDDDDEKHERRGLQHFQSQVQGHQNEHEHKIMSYISVSSCAV